MGGVATGAAEWAPWAVRNPWEPEAIDASYRERFNVTRSDLNRVMLQGVGRDASVLEVGASKGGQLNVLAEQGFGNLTALDICEEALAECPWPTLVGDMRDLPCGDDEYDLVVTSGTLMHVPPNEQKRALSEVLRVAGHWAYLSESWTPKPRHWAFVDPDNNESLCPDAWTWDWTQMLPVPGWHLTKVVLLESNEGMPLWSCLLHRNP